MEENAVIHHECTRKIRYAGKKKAIKHMLRLQNQELRNPNLTLTIYQCRFCKGYHVGNKKENKLIPKDCLILIEEIENSGRKLSRWEKGFVASVKIQAKQNRVLLGTQSTKLQEIYRLSQNGRNREEKT